MVKRLIGKAAAMAAAVDRAVTSRLYYPSIDFVGRRHAAGVEVSGLTDLPDGTVLRYAVNAPGVIGALMGGRTGETLVAGGRFLIAFDPSPWKSSRLEVRVSVLADRHQPPQTRAVLGDRGQRMASDVAGHGHAEYFVTKAIEL